MKTKTIVLTLALCFSGGVVCFAQDPNLGTWKLNEAKSRLSPRAPQNTIVVYEAVGEKLKVTIDGIGSDGKPIHTEWTGRYDGKDYPVIGDPNSDARSVTKIDEHTLGFNITRSGRITVSGRIVVSADGKSRTVTSSGVDLTGKKVSSVLVYDKQQSEVSALPVHPK